MKKFVFVLLSFIILCTLVACGSSNTETSSANSIDKNSSASYIGTWQYDTGKGNVITFTFQKGGIGSYEQTTKENTHWDFSYEIKDEVVVLTRTAVGTTFVASYELNDDGTVLSYISGDMPTGDYTKVPQ